MPRKRAAGSPRVVYRTARCGLRATRAQRRRLWGLLRSAGDVWCCVLEVNAWRRRRQDRPLVGYQELCRELARSGPGTFGELDTAGARSVLRRYSDAWFAAAKRRKAGDTLVRFPRRRRALVPVRWYAGTFRLEGRVLHLPAARGCTPLVVRLDRNPPYPATEVRSVTLLGEAGRLWVEVTAEVPVASYPDGDGPDPGRVAGVDLGIIHPYAAAGPRGQLLLVSGRAIRAECRQHLRDTKVRRRAAARRAPKPGQRGSRRWRQYRRGQRAVEGRHRRRVRQAQHEAAKAVIGWAVQHRVGTLAVGDPRGVLGLAAGRRHNQRVRGLAGRAPDPRPGRQGHRGRDHGKACGRAGHLLDVPRLRPAGAQTGRTQLLLPALRTARAPRPGRGRQHRRPRGRRPHPRPDGGGDHAPPGRDAPARCAPGTT
jgi:transposase